YLVRCMWLFLCSRFGHKYFIVQEWCMKTEYQRRDTPRWHMAAWPSMLSTLSPAQEAGMIQGMTDVQL
ncbi:MAG: hypothetical protein VYC29_08410, partial [Pseudomonadota bacterium]|nr:hypothetical protein [Pseudomonadota bacterium]